MREDEIRARLANATTPGPWYKTVNDTIGGWDVANIDKPSSAYDFLLGDREVAWGISENDADLIAHAPDDFAYLLDENARLREDIKRCTVSIQELQQLREDF